MIRRFVVFIVSACVVFWALASGESAYLYSSEITLHDLFDDGKKVYDAKDILRFSTLWMRNTKHTDEGDLNGDEVVDFQDLIGLTNAYKNNLAPNSFSITDATPTPTPMFDPNATPTLTPTLDPNDTPTPTFDPNATPTPTFDPDATPTPTVDPDATPTPTVDPNATPTSTVDPDATPTPTVDPNATPTSTVDPDATPTPTLDPDATPTPTVDPDATPTSTVDPDATPTPTPTVDPDATPTSTSASGPTNTPTSYPTVAIPTPEIPTPGIPPPEFVRLWELHPSLSLFRNAVYPPSADGYAASEEGYAVIAPLLDGSNSFISIDRFGRIFNRNLPISLSDYSGLALVDGQASFGKFFESPEDTRRFRFESFTMEAIAGELLDVEHLGADAIDWSFCGSTTGAAMAVLRYPNLIVVHRIGVIGEYLGQTEIMTGDDLPTNPQTFLCGVSGDYIAVLYSRNFDSSKSTSTPLSIWILNTSGELQTEEPIIISFDMMIDHIVGDGNGTFYIVSRSSYGPNLTRFTKDGIIGNRVLPHSAIVDIQWQDDMLWVLDGASHVMWGYNEEGILRNGPVSLFPPGWTQAPKWLQLKKSGADLGAFFTDLNTQSTVHYMQIESGMMATPTPLPAPGVPTGVTATVEIGDDLLIDMIKIARGVYTCGSPDSESGRRPNEGPEHTVTLTQDFFISRTEITNQQYHAFNPGKQAPNYGGLDLGLDDMPIVGISWDDANDFCEWLSATTEFTFSLPTEAEWEYVARAGSTTRRPWGDDLGNLEVCAHTNSADVSAASAYTDIEVSHNYSNCDDGYIGPAPVASFPANEFGVYDMLGNVREWCYDWFERYDGSSLTDPSGPGSGKSRIIRGGSWKDGPDVIRCAYRSGRPPDETDANLGFRVVIRED